MKCLSNYNKLICSDSSLILKKIIMILPMVLLCSSVVLRDRQISEKVRNLLLIVKMYNLVCTTKMQSIILVIQCSQAVRTKKRIRKKNILGIIIMNILIRKTVIELWTNKLRRLMLKLVKNSNSTIFIIIMMIVKIIHRDKKEND